MAEKIEQGYEGIERILGRRVYKKVENSGDRNTGDEDRNDTQYFYYNNQWQLLEIRLATYDESGTLTSDKPQRQFVWGTQYIDEAICMDVDTDNDGCCTDLEDMEVNPAGGARRFFYCQDANWNVTALRENTGSGTAIVERYEYDPYGTVRIYRGSPTPGAAELRQVAGSSLSWLDATLPGNPVLYAGYYHDSETKKYHVRNRMLDVDRWMQRDPAGYVDGMNLYAYAHANPAGLVDAAGLGSYRPYSYWHCGACGETENCCAWTQLGEQWPGGMSACLKTMQKAFSLGGDFDFLAIFIRGPAKGIACAYPIAGVIGEAFFWYGIASQIGSRQAAAEFCQTEVCCGNTKPITSSAWYCIFDGCKKCQCPGNTQFGNPGDRRPYPYNIPCDGLGPVCPYR